MPLNHTLLSTLTQSNASLAWTCLVQQCLEIMAQPFSHQGTLQHAMRQREEEISAFDYFLSSIGWDLYAHFRQCVPRTAEQLITIWAQNPAPKAVLILDGLSLRELPFLIEGAKTHGQTHGLSLRSYRATASEIPAETNSFAKALGFSARSQLQHNGGRDKGALYATLQGGAKESFATESVECSFDDCTHIVAQNPVQNWVFWHHFPDRKLHDQAEPEKGLDSFAPEVKKHLTSPEFWAFVKHLAQGRSLIITSDHGYAATGLFQDSKGREAEFLKTTFGAQRFKKCPEKIPENSQENTQGRTEGGFIPPIALRLHSVHGSFLFALGRRKWKCPGGYPTLAHGGLSLLEILCPFLEFTPL